MPDLRDRLAAALAPRYIVDRELASGGMGTVFLGHDPALGREVAIKVLPPEQASAVAVERFLREARLLAKLAHPNIVPVFDAQSSGDLLWFVMPRVPGDTLAHRLAAGPLPGPEVRRIGIELLGALEHAHAHGVIHRDIKPANIFLDGDRPLLADFGVALLGTSGGDTLTGADHVIGTLRYMAPEQRSGGDATERSDMHALAITLYEAATGKRWDVVDGTASSTWRSLPPSLRSGLRRALQADPAARWPTATAFRKALGTAHRSPLARAGIGAAILAALALGVLVASNALRASGPVPSRAELVVLPFGASGDTLGAELARLTSLPMEFSPVRVLPAVLAEHMTVDSAMRIARAVVTGKLVSRDGAVEAVALQVFDSAGRTLASPTIARGGRDIATWALTIADSVMVAVAPIHVTEFRELAQTHPNRRALDAYSEGQRLFQSGRWHEAEAKFADAERFDGQFVEATWHKLIARQWQSLPFKDDLARLAASPARMPPALRRLLQAQVQPELERRFALYDSLVREYPDYSLVREMAANEQFNRGPLIGRPLRAGVQAYLDAAREIPDLNQPNTYTQTVWGAVRLGDERLAREQLRLRKAPKGDDWSDMLWLAVNGRFRRWLAVPAREFILWRADSAYIRTLSRAVRMGLDVDDPWDQRAIGQFLERRASTDAERANALSAQATALLLEGRPLEAIGDLDRGAAAAPADAGYQLQRAEWRVLLPLLPGAPIMLSAATRDSGRRLLQAVAPGDSMWARATWALAVDAVARHAATEADSLIASLQARASSHWIGDLATYATAIRLGAAGQADSALLLSQRIHTISEDVEIGLRGPFVRALIYLHRGAWRLGKLDRKGAESEWIWHENNDIFSKPQGEPEQGEIDAALSGVARLLRAENLPALDRRADGCALIDRVMTLWRNADAAMQTLRARADTARQRCRQ